MAATATLIAASCLLSAGRVGANTTAIQTNFHIYTKGVSIGTQSCKVRTKWKTIFVGQECKALAGNHSSKNRPWQSWTSILDRFQVYYYKPTETSCNNATGTAEDLQMQPNLTQYRDENCTDATGIWLSQSQDACGDWVVGSDNVTQYERYRMDCGLASRLVGSLQRTWLLIAALISAALVRC